MPVRSTMSNLIARIRTMTSDTLPAGSGQIFTDQDVQNVMDETRWDISNVALTPYPTYTGATIQYLDYYADACMNNWEDDVTFKQYRTIPVVPSVSENILGHWQFAVNMLPPVYIQGKTYDVYRSAADLLERWSALWSVAYDFTADGQSLHRSQAAIGLQRLAHMYRMKQRTLILEFSRSDISADGSSGLSLAPTEIDYL